MSIYNLKTGEVTPIPDASEGFVLMYNKETGKYEKQKINLDDDNSDEVTPEMFGEMMKNYLEKFKNLPDYDENGNRIKKPPCLTEEFRQSYKSALENDKNLEPLPTLAEIKEAEKNREYEEAKKAEELMKNLNLESSESGDVFYFWILAFFIVSIAIILFFTGIPSNPIFVDSE